MTLIEELTRMQQAEKEETEASQLYTKTIESLLKERDRVMDAIPECPIHGRQCVPHALEWIEEHKEAQRKAEEEVKSNDHGDTFLNECRSVISECSHLSPERAARVAIFALCVMLDGSGESLGLDYVLSVRDGDGKLEPVIFNHHDL